MKKPLIFILFFAVVGSVLLLIVRAAEQVVSFEAENGQLTAGATIANDTTASGGRFVQFDSITPPPPPPPTACSGPTVALTGTPDVRYRNYTPAPSTTFQLAGWYSNAVRGPGNSQAFDVGMSNAPNGVCVMGGVVNGQIDLALDWRVVHDSIGGFAYRTVTSGVGLIDGARIHNVEDGWKPRECPDGTDSCNVFANGNGRMLMRNVYMSGIRDDSIENDDFMPGDIEDSLFDGTWTFLSEQLQHGGNVSIGVNEDKFIRLNRVYVRSYTTNANEVGAGPWFKWQGAIPHHTPIITDSVFAVDKKPRSGWGSLDIPAGTQWNGSNFILWLGPTGGYGGPKPAGVTFLEGQSAKDKWSQVRNSWLTAHGYQSRPVDDFNPMDDPVVAPN